MATRKLTIGTQLRGRYRIIQLVGGGGMALVYRVEDLQKFGQQWALKVLHPFSNDPDDLVDAKRLFDQEAEILLDLDHPNLPKVEDHFEENNRAFLVMEFIEGQSLQDVLEGATFGLLETEVLGWMIQVCHVLDYLHNQTPPVIFRDLKPGNIMLSDNGVIKLIDFGIARTYKSYKKKDTITMGSANYAPLEQWGKGQTDARSDVYGLGATIYHLLTKRLPPLASEVSRKPPSTYNPALSPETEAIILKAMAKEPKDRYQSAREMQRALEKCLIDLGGLPVHVPKPPPAITPASTPAAAAPNPSPAAAPAPDPSPAAAAPDPLPPAVAVAAPVPDPVPAAAPAADPAPAVAKAADPAPSVAAAPDPTPPPVPAPDPGVVCSSCGNTNRTGARFCGRCGKHLSGQLEGVLKLLASDGKTQSLLLAQLPYVMGRGRGSDGSVPDLDLSVYDERFVSRRHAQITRPAGEFMLTDLNSSNGTLLNGVRLKPHMPQVLRSGDKITIGKVHLQFRVMT